MSWLGKILGGALGFALGGPLGALVGVALGHNFDRPTGAARGRGWADPDLLDAGDAGDFLDEPDLLDPRERTQTAFFTATFSVLGHLAKADRRRHPRRDPARLAGHGRTRSLRRPPQARPAAVSRRAGPRLPPRRGARSAPPRVPLQLPSRHHVRRDPAARGVRRRRAACAGARAAPVGMRAPAPSRRGAGPPRGDGAGAAPRAGRQALGHALGRRRLRDPRRGGGLLGRGSSSAPTAG